MNCTFYFLLFLIKNSAICYVFFYCPSYVTYTLTKTDKLTTHNITTYVLTQDWTCDIENRAGLMTVRRGGWLQGSTCIFGEHINKNLTFKYVWKSRAACITLFQTVCLIILCKNFSSKLCHSFKHFFFFYKNQSVCVYFYLNYDSLSGCLDKELSGQIWILIFNILENMHWKKIYSVFTMYSENCKF